MAVAGTTPYVDHQPPCRGWRRLLARGAGEADLGRRRFRLRPGLAGTAVEGAERAYVAGVLGLHGGKLSAAARHADMDNKNLWEKMVRYGLRSRAAAGEPPPEPAA